MDVTATTSVTTTTSSGGKAAQTSDYQTFLKMLTTQLQNQDPTAPMESSDFAVQLATFSGVEQQTLTNQHLASLGRQINGLAFGDLSSWLGGEAMVHTPVSVEGRPLTLYPQIAPKADAAVLVVKDMQGNTIARSTLDPKEGSTEWTPVDATGAPLPSGKYTLSVESLADGTQIATGSVGHYVTVAEARSGAQGTMLVLADGTEIAAADVTSFKR